VLVVVLVSWYLRLLGFCFYVDTVLRLSFGICVVALFVVSIQRHPFLGPADPESRVVLTDLPSCSARVGLIFLSLLGPRSYCAFRGSVFLLSC